MTGLFCFLRLALPFPLQKFFEERFRDGRLQFSPISQAMIDLAKLLRALCRGEQLSAILTPAFASLPWQF